MLKYDGKIGKCLESLFCCQQKKRRLSPVSVGVLLVRVIPHFDFDHDAFDNIPAQHCRGATF